ncbi:heme anaerobic degradation radical SAM methyltransferase ChuW/HutW [Edwardsiella sp. LADL05-105]|uniref:heme anaerobic degradation radical SAM methyltransferase ChuW/HutW n=1 Tax=Edwardsiella sp. LADL05-105 TaxID=1650654 RepID=UPI001CEDCBE8|nr:heme anaerobic degradation radical SAM methyltransferase ChuW/HutW [Edwardsiella sp. LADL05-105]UBU95028.1 heme anaerobic degradation radical SAM methyltransferase ChuW/HutW [Edwardsiella sp. LADL05-105]
MTLDITPYLAAAEGIPFPERWATMPWRHQQPLPADALAQGWQQLCQRTLSPNKRLIYVHIPFCATHCTFCGFYQNRFSEQAVARYCDYLQREIALESALPLQQSAPIHAVYLGGGTPSALSAEQLYRLITQLRSALPLAADGEITVEGRVLNFDDARIDACLAAGANRFSIGIQTFDTRLRQRMGRRADRDRAIAFLRALAERDRAAVICDLMFGLPGQTAREWQNDLDIVNDLPLDGVDLYALNLLPSTPLAKAVANARARVADAAERQAFYLHALDELDKRGWRQLSNSHWARTTRERNLYNLLIKQGADCLAFGSGAGGHLDGQSYMLQRSLEAYYQRLDTADKPLMMLSAPAPQHRWRLALQGGIETGRLDLATLLDDPAPLLPLLLQWQSCDLLRLREHCLTLTPRGRFWASNLLQALQQLLAQLLAPSQTTPSSAGARAAHSPQHTHPEKHHAS